MVQDANEDGAKVGCAGRLSAWWENFKLTIWNGERKEFIGRTGWSWACILLFYAAYFLFTGGYFAVCFSIFMKTIDDRVPTFQRYYSMLKFNPGMNYVPQWPLDSTYIGFNQLSNESFMNDYVSRLTSEIKRYQNVSDDESEGNVPSTFDSACRFDTSTLKSECTGGTFGYSDGKPCILMRINNVYGWNPTPFKPSNLSCLINNDSNECAFFNLTDAHRSAVREGFIPVSCEGEESADKENLIKVTFYPAEGFPMNCYPYYKQTDFLPPLVAARFEVKKGVVVMINCKFWTSDIKHDLDDRQGSFHLELMVDGPTENSTLVSPSDQTNTVTASSFSTESPSTPTSQSPANATAELNANVTSA